MKGLEMLPKKKRSWNCLICAFSFVASPADGGDFIPQHRDRHLFHVRRGWWCLCCLKHGELPACCKTRFYTGWLKQNSNSRLWCNNKPLWWLNLTSLCAVHANINTETILSVKRVPTKSSSGFIWLSSFLCFDPISHQQWKKNILDQQSVV